MDDDERFGALFHRAVTTLEPPTQRLVDAGLARGRRQRRWIRGAELGTAALVLGAVGVLAASLLGGGAVPDRGAPAATGGNSAPPAATTVAMTSQALLQTALDTLPRAGGTTGYRGTVVDGFVSASFVYDDGAGAAEVDVSMTSPPAASGPKSAAVTRCVAGVPGCSVLADGAHVMVRQGHQYNDSRTPNPAEWDLDLVRADGVQISFIEFNAPQGKAAATTRPTPPFSLAELTAWADNAVWQTRIPEARAARAAHLFTPVDLGARAADRTASLDRQKLAACRAAVRAHKINPDSCQPGH